MAAVDVQSLIVAVSYHDMNVIRQLSDTTHLALSYCWQQMVERLSDREDMGDYPDDGTTYPVRVLDLLLLLHHAASDIGMWCEEPTEGETAVCTLIRSSMEGADAFKVLSRVLHLAPDSVVKPE